MSKTIKGLNLIKEISEVTTQVQCPVCGEIFILEDCKTNKSASPVSLFFVNCPKCNEELNFFFWFEW